jgi:hypothetical protein
MIERVSSPLLFFEAGYLIPEYRANRFIRISSPFVSDEMVERVSLAQVSSNISCNTLHL